MKSEAVQICEAIETALQAEGHTAATYRWMPAFRPEDAADPQISIRPARRSVRRKKAIADRDVMIEIGIVQQLPQVDKSEDVDGFNLYQELEAFDLLAETIADYFVVDEETPGILAGRVADYLPSTIEQTSITDAERLRESRQLITILTITYQRHG